MNLKALMAKLKISAAQRKKLEKCWRELSNRGGGELSASASS